MKAYGRKRQHPKGYPDIKLKRGDKAKGWRPWWEAESAQPEKGRARKENQKEIEMEEGGKYDL